MENVDLVKCPNCDFTQKEPYRKFGSFIIQLHSCNGEKAKDSPVEFPNQMDKLLLEQIITQKYHLESIKKNIQFIAWVMIIGIIISVLMAIFVGT